MGVGVDSSKHIYVANSGSAAITVYAIPSPTVAPSTTPSPTPSPSPSVSPSTSPSPTPTPFSNNIAPITTIAGTNTQLASPLGIGFDAAGNLYVADAGSSTVAPKILIFNAPFGAGLQNVAPSHVIISQNPAFVNPTDVKIDSMGDVYVVDAGAGPNANSKLFIFIAGSQGVVTPTNVIALPQGSAMGTALSP